ncbi:MAG TPA: SH3 domain-containing protein [Dongiaceae bacterium]|nr:SH3 domain-containing protein [Dongiaceae bacterium]
MKHFAVIAGFLLASSFAAVLSFPQAVPYARSFSQSKEQIEEALKSLQAFSGQKLPILDGFVASTTKPLERYERGFYQFSIETLPGDHSATVVRLSAKITAWYADRDVSKSGYEVLPSNGRLELDFLDRLQEKLTGKPVDPPATLADHVDAPRAKLDLSGVPGASAPSAPNALSKTPNEVAEMRNQRVAEERRVQQLTQELQNLKEIQRSQGHPQTLLVVTRADAAVYSKPSETARLLFRAAVNDEFEYLDSDDGWIHIEISGDARGYIRENVVQLPERLAAKASPAEGNPEAKFKGFQIARQDVSSFPGDWAPLKGKTVKIYTVRPVLQDPQASGPLARLSLTLALFAAGANEAANASPKFDGVVVIVDAPDGGIASATLADIQSFSSGSLTRDKFLAQCNLDPEEAFRPAKQ